MSMKAGVCDGQGVPLDHHCAASVALFQLFLPAGTLLPLRLMSVAQLTCVSLYQRFAFFVMATLKKDGTPYTYKAVLYHIRAVLAHASQLPQCQGSAEASEFFSVLKANAGVKTWFAHVGNCVERLIFKASAAPPFPRVGAEGRRGYGAEDDGGDDGDIPPPLVALNSGAAS